MQKNCLHYAISQLLAWMLCNKGYRTYPHFNENILLWWGLVCKSYMTFTINEVSLQQQILIYEFWKNTRSKMNQYENRALMQVAGIKIQLNFIKYIVPVLHSKLKRTTNKSFNFPCSNCRMSILLKTWFQALKSYWK